MPSWLPIAVGRLARGQPGEEAQLDHLPLIVGQRRERTRRPSSSSWRVTPTRRGPASVGCRSSTQPERECSRRVRTWSMIAFLASRKSQPPNGTPRAS